MTNSKHHKLFYGSSYDRGLDILLEMWDDIKQRYPDATLDICYGWDLFDVAATNNKERQQWKKYVSELMNKPGITHHGRISQDELRKVRQQCGIWAYPTYFTEIFCITAIEAQNDGLVPVTMSLAALPETAKNGVLVDGPIYKKETKEKFKQALFELMDDEKKWEEMSHKCEKFARKFSWQNQASKWIEQFEKPLELDMKVTIYTPTLREGWFNVMASNLASQTHKNFEWIIVDAHKEDRSEIAKKYAQDYGLDIKYIHQEKTKRTYSLANANNVAIKNATGDLFVFLQDFVLLTPTALEELIVLSKRHPGDFLAPCDNYFYPKIKPDMSNKEDWFNGDLDVIGKFMRRNVRIQNKGVRTAETVTDFEQNFGAVPTATLRHLNGYYEFFDEALGWDDTEIIYRALKLGYKLWIDDTNQCVCLDHWGTLGNNEGGTSVNRTRRMNDPRYEWMVRQIELGKLPVIRNEKQDAQINLQYTIPDDVPDDKCVAWVDQNLGAIIKEWKDL